MSYRKMPIIWWNKEYYSLRAAQNSFTHQPWANGVVLIVCVILAMLLANLPFTKDVYRAFLETELTMHLKSPGGQIDWIFPAGMTVEKFINDVIMVFFFFHVTLEIKREINTGGELSTPKKAMLPVIAAFGGVIVPALIFAIINHGTPAASGWGIPTATDIAFAVGIMAILGDKVPISLRVFITALAIADDLIAILVVAIFYGGTINFGLLSIGLVLALLAFILQRINEKRLTPYVLIGIAMWFIFYYSGIHATMSGVVMAFLIPMEARYNSAKFHRRSKILYEGLIESEKHGDSSEFPNVEQRYYLRHLSNLTRKTIGQSYWVSHKMNPIVNFLIMPLFALANAGVEITDPAYFNIFHFSVETGAAGLGIFLGLVLGKPLGITLASFLAIKCKVGEMPAGASWKMLFAVACLGGIGFTMSIFVDTLSFSDFPTLMVQMRDAGKIAVLLGSITAGLLGSFLIVRVYKQEHKTC